MEKENNYFVIFDNMGRVHGVFTEENKEIAEKLSFMVSSQTGDSVNVEPVKGLNTFYPHEKVKDIDIESVSKMVYAWRSFYYISFSGAFRIESEREKCLIDVNDLDTFEIKHDPTEFGARYVVSYYSLNKDYTVSRDEILKVVQKWKIEHISGIW